ncbi:MAG: FAD-dependent oxidoreductase [Eubacteriales bacterium]
MKSVWTNIELPHFSPLEKSVKTDVLIIGGGMAGLLSAYRLSRAGVHCLLLEADKICSGITHCTTAKITSQHGFIYQKLVKRFGEDGARQYYEANQKAVADYRELCGSIDCDFEPADSFVYTLDDEKKAEREWSACQKAGIPAEYADTLPLPIQTRGAIRFKDQAQFHPLKFAAAIAKDLRICEHTAVRELMPGAAKTDYGTVWADKIIVATHFPFCNKHGSYFLKLYQSRSYVIALENAQDVSVQNDCGHSLHGIYVDEAEGGLSFRNAGNLLLLGGNGHRTGKKGSGWDALTEFAEQNYPNCKIVSRFATQDTMSLDGIPYIGRYSARTEGLYVATGFNKWGMSSSMVAANLLSDLVQGKENRYARLFSPSRSILRPQLLVNAYEALTNLLTPTAKRCPHMGCALKWNPYEHTWDCPCHGSRFTEDGRLIDNPATGDLKKT